MRRRLPAHTRLHVHAEALAHDHGGDPHDALATLEGWEQALADEETERRLRGALAAGAGKIAASPEFSVSGVLGDACYADAPDAVVEAIVDAVAEWPQAGQRRPGAPGNAIPRRS